MKRVHVVAAVIRDKEGNVFISRRAEHAHQGGKLEFPGGKREAGESRLEALKRELKEELGIEVGQAKPLIQIQHDYTDKQILLDVWEVFEFTGEPHGAEGQETFWMKPSELEPSKFPEANVPIIHAVKLPRMLMVTSSSMSDGELGVGVKGYVSCLADYEVPHIYVRMPTQAKEQAIGYLQSNVPGARLLATECEDEGVAHHFTAEGLTENSDVQPTSASVHSLAQLQLAHQSGASFVILGAVMSTPSHPGGQVLGWDGAESLIKQSKLPVYLIGGMKRGDLDRAIEIGAQGIAGISMFAGEGG